MVDFIRVISFFGIVIMIFILCILIKNFINLRYMINENRRMSKLVKRKEFLKMKNGGINPDTLVNNIQMIKIDNEKCNVIVKGKIV